MFFVGQQPVCRIVSHKVLQHCHNIGLGRKVGKPELFSHEVVVSVLKNKLFIDYVVSRFTNVAFQIITNPTHIRLDLHQRL